MNELILGDNLIPKTGLHSIAVKAVGNEGLEVIEAVKVKVNGVVEVK